MVGCHLPGRGCRPPNEETSLPRNEAMTMRLDMWGLSLTLALEELR